MKPTREQAEFLINKTAELRAKYPLLLEEDEQKQAEMWSQLIEEIDTLCKRAKNGEILKRWMMTFIHSYQDESKIISGKGQTSAEYFKAHYKPLEERCEELEQKLKEVSNEV